MHKKYWLLISLLGFVVFLASEWWVKFPSDIKLIVLPDFVVVQDLSGQVYHFGDPDLWERVKPFGHFLNQDSVISVENITVGKRIKKLTRWSENFSSLEVSGQRIFWFDEGFSIKEVTKLPVNLASDIWILNKVVPESALSIPTSTVIWVNSERRVPKKLKTLVTTHQIPLLVLRDLGEVSLQFGKTGWALR